MKHILLGAIGACVLAAPAAQAATSSLFGDIDCFGTGFVCADGVIGTGSSGDFTTFVSAMSSDPTSPITDTQDLSNGVSWTHSYAGIGDTMASLEFRTYAMADNRGPYDVTVNGTSIGSIAIVTGSTFGSQQVVTHSYSFGTSLLVDGINTIELVKLGGGFDSWALDYALLTTMAPAVPLPASLPLLLVGMGGFAALRRKRKAS